MNLADLKAPFKQTAIHWRAQSVTKDGSKAMALAYLDARDVMDRLDEVVGQNYWQDEYTCLSNGTMICRIGICAGEWVWKSDGAGKTDVEAEKGQISDAFKRAAVKWGIGRYLYDMPKIWVPCEVDNRGKWRKWTADPWGYVKGKPTQAAPAPPKQERQITVPKEPGPIAYPGVAAEEHEWRTWINAYKGAITGSASVSEIALWEHANDDARKALQAIWAKGWMHVKEWTDSRRGMLSQAPAEGG